MMNQNMKFIDNDNQNWTNQIQEVATVSNFLWLSKYKIYPIITSISNQHPKQIHISLSRSSSVHGRRQHGLQSGQDEGRHQVRVQAASTQESLCSCTEVNVFRS